MDQASQIVVAGAGNAALTAALAAREAGAEVLVLEAAPANAAGGNTAYTGGGMRFAYKGPNDLVPLLGDISELELAKTDLGSYPQEQFFDDVARVTAYRSDPELAELLVLKSYETMKWLNRNGVRFVPIYGRQAFEIDGKFTFWGGLTVEVSGGGKGLVAALLQKCAKAGVKVVYDTPVTDVIWRNGKVQGVVTESRGRRQDIAAKAVILASGGFEANAAWRARYLGPGWDLARVRGSRFNTGRTIGAAFDIGAMSYGHWSGCHSVAWDYNAPPFGDLNIGDQFQKHSYPLGIMVNRDGKRFVDEGADFRNYTYAKYGGKVLQQPEQMAWQVFDAKVDKLLREEYRIRQVTKVSAGSLENLAAQMHGIDQRAFLETVRGYNEAIDGTQTFNPNILDGRRTLGLSPEKSNWANPIDSPPFTAFAVTCGITFTFGGVKISREAEVERDSGEAIPGLYAAGEMVGGLYYFNYPGGSGLTSGAVFGRQAGTSAAAYIAAR